MSEYVTIMRLRFKHLVRPKEILMLRLRDIDFREGAAPHTAGGVQEP